MFWLKRSNTIVTALLTGIFSIPAVFSLLRLGFFNTDDASWMIIRFSAFFASLADGQIPVRFLEGLNFGYGYPVANFLYPGFMYLATLLHLVGLGFVDSIKVLLILSIILSGIFTFLWLKTLFDNLSAFLGALVFVYTPYHLYDVYTRGSVGEVLAFVFLPLALFGSEKRNYILISLSVFFLIISHNSLAVIFLLLLFMYSIFRKRNRALSLCGIGTGVLLSSFFIIPAVFELGYTNFKSTKISNPLEYFANLELVGVISIFVLFVSVFLYIIYYRKSVRLSPYLGLFVLFGFVSLLSIFLSISYSEVLWKTPISTLFQFPFRVLSLLLVSNAFLAGYILYLVRGKLKIVLFGVTCIVLVYSSINFLQPKEFNSYPDEYYSTNPATTTVKNEYMPIWVKSIPSGQYASKVEMLNGSAQIEKLVEKSNRISFNLTGNTSSIVRVNTIYYPGWKAYVNNDQVKISYDNPRGVMEIPVKRSEERVLFVFRETALRTISNSVTVLSFTWLLFYFLRPVLKFK